MKLTKAQKTEVGSPGVPLAAALRPSRHLFMIFVILFAGQVLTLQSSKGNNTMKDCNNNAVYQSAKSLLDQATTALNVSNYKDSNTLLDEAISIMGNSYSDPNAPDDTAMNLTFARLQEKKGNLNIAANLKRELVIVRLDKCCNNSNFNN